jgi:hypothetical protein
MCESGVVLVAGGRFQQSGPVGRVCLKASVFWGFKRRDVSWDECYVGGLNVGSRCTFIAEGIIIPLYIWMLGVSASWRVCRMGECLGVEKVELGIARRGERGILKRRLRVGLRMKVEKDGRTSWEESVDDGGCLLAHWGCVSGGEERGVDGERGGGDMVWRGY